MVYFLVPPDRGQKKTALSQAVLAFRHDKQTAYRAGHQPYIECMGVTLLSGGKAVCQCVQYVGRRCQWVVIHVAMSCSWWHQSLVRPVPEQSGQG